MKINKIKIFSSLIILSLLFLCFSSLQSKSVYYLTPDEALEQRSTLGEKQIRIGGMVLGGSVEWKAKSVDLDFVLTDMNQSSIQVHYYGAPPDMFKENSGVVVQGYFKQGANTFEAKTLMVKHSEEYKPPGEKSNAHKLVARSLFKENEE